MTMPDSQSLLAEYAKSASEAAFRELVNRYVDLVYSTAFRLTSRDRALAEDVTQMVFVDLARKAKTLPPNLMLGGWLHRHTCFLAGKAVRSERRRQDRERQALDMNTLMNDSAGTLANAAHVLDETLNQLPPDDRAAILLRFYERRDFRSVGQAVGTSEDAARMRVNRALEKLHGLLRQRGVTLSATALGAALTIEAVVAAPAGLAATIASKALAAAPTGLGLIGVLSRFASLTGGLKATAILATSAVVIGFLGTYHFYHQPASRVSATDHTKAAPNVVNKTPRPSKPQGPLRFNNGADAPLTAIDLEAAKRDLRGLLDRPQPQTQYPPPALTAALRRFEAEWLEAIPILLERIETSDFETRKWALYGLWDMSVNFVAFSAGPTPEAQAQALARAQPRLADILRSPAEPVELRRIAVQCLVPSWAGRKILTPTGEQLLTPPRPLDEGTLASMVAVLQSPDKASEGFRFELIQPLLAEQLRSFPEEARTIRDALAPMIEHGDPKQQFLAAYALAAIPGEKPPGLQDILVRALDLHGKSDVSFTYRAADALGMLGPEAKDAVPALLKFAEATKGWGTSGYREHALEAACRIQPELRAQYPDADVKLTQSEGSHRQETPALRTSPDHEAGQKPPALSLQALLVDGRSLLLEQQATNASALEELFNQWNAWYREHPTESAVTPERFAELSRAIQQADAAFHKTWLKQVVKSYPNLDRVVRGEQP
jgi:RNA polymerase sigma factor (sigma-70 family)